MLVLYKSYRCVFGIKNLIFPLGRTLIGYQKMFAGERDINWKQMNSREASFQQDMSNRALGTGERHRRWWWYNSRCEISLKTLQERQGQIFSSFCVPVGSSKDCSPMNWHTQRAYFFRQFIPYTIKHIRKIIILVFWRNSSSRFYLP
jgi:hypothetical protein